MQPFRIKYLLWALCLGLGAGSCSFSDPLGECGLDLHFKYDYNMAYADAAPGQVDRIDVLVFDAGGKYLFTKSVGEAALLENEYRVSLFEELPRGCYTLFAWGGLSEDFRLLDAKSGQEGFTPGQTTADEVRLSLQSIAIGNCDTQLHPVWYGEPLTIDYDPRRGEQTYTMDLIRNTNRFNIALDEEKNTSTGTGGLLAYTFEVISTGYELYDAANQPVGDQEIYYLPYRISTAAGKTQGELNTVRLLAGQSQRLVIRSAQSHQILWSVDLIGLLARTRPSSIASLQEYLDRQNDWNLIFSYKDDGTPDSFIAVKVYINGWIVWFDDIDI